jgi:hypothetical protein
MMHSHSENERNEELNVFADMLAQAINERK